jgi:hypothetical protein
MSHLAYIKYNTNVGKVSSGIMTHHSLTNYYKIEQIMDIAVKLKIQYGNTKNEYIDIYTFYRLPTAADDNHLLSQHNFRNYQQYLKKCHEIVKKVVTSKNSMLLGDINWTVDGVLDGNNRAGEREVNKFFGVSTAINHWLHTPSYTSHAGNGSFLDVIIATPDVHLKNIQIFDTTKRSICLTIK